MTAAMLLALFWQEPSQEEFIGIGRKVFATQCASCHFVPDTKIPRDKAWLDMIAATA